MSSAPQAGDLHRVLHAYIRDYMFKHGYEKSAAAITAEAKLSNDIVVEETPNSLHGALLDWWSLSLDLFCAQQLETQRSPVYPKSASPDFQVRRIPRAASVTGPISGYKRLRSPRQLSFPVSEHFAEQAGLLSKDGMLNIDAAFDPSLWVNPWPEDAEITAEGLSSAVVQQQPQPQPPPQPLIQQQSHPAQPQQLPNSHHCSPTPAFSRQPQSAESRQAQPQLQPKAEPQQSTSQQLLQQQQQQEQQQQHPQPMPPQLQQQEPPLQAHHRPSPDPQQQQQQQQQRQQHLDQSLQQPRVHPVFPYQMDSVGQVYFIEAQSPSNVDYLDTRLVQQLTITSPPTTPEPQPPPSTSNPFNFSQMKAPSSQPLPQMFMPQQQFSAAQPLYHLPYENVHPVMTVVSQDIHLPPSEYLNVVELRGQNGDVCDPNGHGDENEQVSTYLLFALSTASFVCVIYLCTLCSTLISLKTGRP